MSRAGRGLGLALAGLLAMTDARGEPAPRVGDARLEALAFSSLDGWAEDDHAAAFRTFGLSCQSLAAQAPVLRPAQAPDQNLAAGCRAALGAGELDREAARRFFEARFEPYEVVPPSGRGFLTGYYEPVFQGSRTPTARFTVPLLARPDDLVTVPQGGSLPGLAPGLQAARRTPHGYEPYPDRAAIEDGALRARAVPIVYLEEPGEAFIIHVQGSARIRLPDGSALRVAFAGKNGHPYT